MAKSEIKSIVFAQFASADKAAAAADALKAWDKANDAIKLGAIQIITSEDGKVKNKKHGPRNTGHGAKVGTIVGVVAGVLSGGLTLVAGAVYGAVAGGLLGSLRKKGVKISDEELQKMQQWLEDGKAIMVAMCSEDEMAATSDEMTALGAIAVKSFALTEDAYKALDEAAAKVQDQAGDSEEVAEAATAEVVAQVADEAAPASDEAPAA